jgi:hypothetical protein
MDPISILGAASAAVQFVDFASKLMYGTYEIYKTGSASFLAGSDLESITKSLNELNTDILTELAKTPSGTEMTKRDKTIDNLCRDCNVVAVELLKALENLRLQTHNTVWNSFRKALATVPWKPPKIHALRKRLESFSQQICLHMVVSIQ